MISNHQQLRSRANLPDFIVIGAMKAGTTSLQKYLESHPAVSMAPKELEFFNGLTWERGLDWYRMHFPDNQKVQGEISPGYSKCHAHPDTPKNIHSTIPDVKLIYILREPVARIVSHFSHAIAEDTRGRSSAEILEQSLDHFVNTSRYLAQLERYLEYFPLEQILIVTTENLRRNRQETLSSVFRFIGVDDSFSCKSFRQVRHDSSVKVRRNSLGRIVARHPVLRRLETGVKSLVPYQWYPFFAKLLGSPFPKPVLSTKVHNEILRSLRDDIQGLKELTGYGFDEWHQ